MIHPSRYYCTACSVESVIARHEPVISIPCVCANTGTVEHRLVSLKGKEIKTSSVPVTVPAAPLPTAGPTKLNVSGGPVTAKSASK